MNNSLRDKLLITEDSNDILTNSNDLNYIEYQDDNIMYQDDNINYQDDNIMYQDDNIKSELDSKFLSDMKNNSNLHTNIDIKDNEIEINDNFDEINYNDLNDNDLQTIYNYYIYNGFYTILSIQLIKFLSSGFLIFLLIFLIKCIDYEGLNKLNKKENNIYFFEYININNFINFNLYEILLSIVLVFYFILKITVVVNDIKRYIKIKKYYENELKLGYYDLINCDWNYIVDKIKYKNGPKYNIYNINSKILKKDNFIILLSKTNLGKFLLSKLMELTIIDCIINNIIILKKRDLLIKKNDIKIINKQLLKSKCIYKLLTISMFIFISMPVLIVYITFFSFLKYGEKFYNEPNKLFNKQLKNNSNYKLRYYNEFREDFIKRNNISLQYIKNYSDIFKLNYVKIIVKFITFVLSSLFIILICLSLYNENILLHLHISKNKSVLWYLGIFGSIITILKNVTKETKKEIKNSDEIYKKIIQYNKLLDINKIKNDKYRIKNINKELKYQLIILLIECFSVLLVPFYLIYLCNYVNNIILFLEKNINYDEYTGIIVKQSDFRVLNNNSNKSSLISFNEFRTKYPKWGANIEIYQIGEISILNDTYKNNYTIFDNTIDSNISII